MKKLIFAETTDDVHDYVMANNLRSSQYIVATERHRCYGLRAEDYQPVFHDGWTRNLDVMGAYNYLKLNSAFAEKFEKEIGDEA